MAGVLDVITKAEDEEEGGGSGGGDAERSPGGVAAGLQPLPQTRGDPRTTPCEPLHLVGTPAQPCGDLRTPCGPLHSPMATPAHPVANPAPHRDPRAPHATMASSGVKKRNREEFRRYLERTGVLDVITKLLVQLYEEVDKPSNAMDFLKQHLSLASGPGCARSNVEALRIEASNLRVRVEALQEENQEFRIKLACYELMET